MKPSSYSGYFTRICSGLILIDLSQHNDSIQTILSLICTGTRFVTIFGRLAFKIGYLLSNLGGTAVSKILKWIGIILGGAVLLLIVIIIGLVVYGQVNFKRTFERPVYEINADTSPEGIARGEYLLESVMGCDNACHSPEGKPFQGESEEINFGPVKGVFTVPNLTPDKETGLGNWSDGEIARAIREGIDREGVELVVMPSYSYHALSDADVAAIIGYLRSLEPVRHELPPFEVNAIGKVMVALRMFGPASLGEPITSPQVTPQIGTVDYGGYLTSIGDCRACHGKDLGGGPLPFAEEGSPTAADLTPSGDLASWSEDDFLKVMRNGISPDGRTIDPEAMPWPTYGNMKDADLQAIYEYLQTLPAASTRN
jgi:mono/diheme cytochrome c family protein